jgi:anti-anti-sigma factor
VANAAVNAGVFEIGQVGDTIIIVPAIDLRELEYQRIEEGAAKILHLLNASDIKNVVMDFHKTDYYGSTALGFFVKLWKRVRKQNRRMAFCNVSDHEREILELTNLDRSWPICSSRTEALRSIRG